MEHGSRGSNGFARICTDLFLCKIKPGFLFLLKLKIKFMRTFNNYIVVISPCNSVSLCLRVYFFHVD